MNRKERFFTGTVLPMIICADDFTHFDRFTALIEGYRARPQPLDWHPATTNVQLFTEYSLVESIHGPARARFPDPPKPKDTPDVMILIAGEASALIAVEAKMYHRPTAADLQEQMRAQAKILDYLRAVLGIKHVHHLALVPQALADEHGSHPFQVLTWEHLLHTFSSARGEDYFTAVLRIALESYDELAAAGSMSNFGANNQGYMTGAEIARLRAAGAGPAVMGRNRGLDGPVVAEDLATGRWRTQRYETRAEGPPQNRNWFSVEEFCARADRS
jgi:hypothetical protein